MSGSNEQEDEVSGGINQLTKLLGGLDDRGLVLSIAAFAEEALGELLKEFMIPSEATTQLIEGFNAPLGTFSSRIKAAYSVGLLTKEQFQDLERLRKIRNEYAHSWKPVDTSKQRVAALIDNMTFSKLDDKFPSSRSEKIRSAMSCLLIELRFSARKIANNQLQAKAIGAHLVRGFPGDFESQIQIARSEFTNLASNLDGATGEKRKFYLNLLVILKDRLTVLKEPESQSQKQALAALLEEFDGFQRKISA